MSRHCQRQNYEDALVATRNSLICVSASVLVSFSVSSNGRSKAEKMPPPISIYMKYSPKVQVSFQFIAIVQIGNDDVGGGAFRAFYS